MLETPSRIFEAKYPFTCVCCDERFPAGTMAYYDSQSLLRNGEADHIWPVGSSQSDANGREPNGRLHDVMPHGKTATDRCDRCFIIHATGQVDCY
jgi:hypothetical protein